MSYISKYWHFVKFNSANKHQVEVNTAAQNYLQAEFSESPDISHTEIIRHLWQQMQQNPKSSSNECHLSEICLRCYISGQIYQVCLDLAQRFGRKYGFDCEDLLPFVISDEILWAKPRKSEHNSSYKSLTTNILDTFDPNKGSLNMWVNRYVKQNKDLKKFLLEHGVYLIRGWAILNDVTTKELQRCFVEMYNLTEGEIKHKQELLVSYHAVYREDRLQQRLRGTTTPCEQPSSQQLTRIANELKDKTGKILSNEAILSQLQSIATKIRQFRIANKGGVMPSVSADRPEIQPLVEQRQIVDEQDGEEIAFMQLYRHQFIESLDQAIAVVIGSYINKLQSKKNKKINKADSFKTGLHFFHCLGKSMTEIAPEINLTKQYEVTRLLNLKELRADIRQNMLIDLRDRILEIAQHFADSQKLQNLDQQVESILDEQIIAIIQEAESEVKNPIRNQPLRSLFAHRLCLYLNQNQEFSKIEDCKNSKNVTSPQSRN